MKEETLSIEQYSDIFYNAFDSVKGKRVVNVIGIPLSTRKMKELGSARKLVIESLADLKSLQRTNLVWYRNKNNNDPVMWDTPDSINLILREAAEIYKVDPSWYNKVHLKKFNDLLESLKNGLTANVEIISIFDATLNVRLAVDGLTRLVALYHLYLYEKYLLAKLLESAYKITIVEYVTKLGWAICPCDFMALYRHKSRD